MLITFSHLKTEANMNSTDFQLQEMDKNKNIELLEEGKVEGISLAIVISIVALVGIMIRGLFIYYVKYAAPKERPINTLMLYDQVRNMHSQSANIFK